MSKPNTLFGFLFLCFALMACGQTGSGLPGNNPVGQSDLPNAEGLPTQATLSSSSRAIWLPHASIHSAVAWSPDGTKFAVSSQTRNQTDPLLQNVYQGNHFFDYGVTQIYDAQTLTPLFEFNEASTNLQWSADGQELMGGAFSIWDTRTGQRMVHWDALDQIYFEPENLTNVW
jgi:WD40 repeat protein